MMVVGVPACFSPGQLNNLSLLPSSDDSPARRGVAPDSAEGQRAKHVRAIPSRWSSQPERRRPDTATGQTARAPERPVGLAASSSADAPSMLQGLRRG